VIPTAPQQRNAKVIELDRFRRTSPALRASAEDDAVVIRRTSAGRFDFSFDVAPSDAVSVMSVCLLVCAKLLAQMPTAA
jgi:hypothetical protein